MITFCQIGCSSTGQRYTQTPIKAKKLTLIEERKLKVIVASTPNTRKQEFFETTVPIALALQEKYDVPASAMLAMSLYESRYGTSKLAIEAKNYFGIKALDRKWKGKVYRIQTRDGRKKHVQPFRYYDSIEESFHDYITFLKSNRRYRKAFLALESKQFVRTVLRSGYCPDRTYYAAILAILSNNNLLSLDTTMHHLRE